MLAKRSEVIVGSEIRKMFRMAMGRENALDMTVGMPDFDTPQYIIDAAKQAIDDGYTSVVIGIGSIEQHGPHLPLKTDSVIGESLAYNVALRLEKTLMAPMIRVGRSEHHLAFPGSISMRNTTLKGIIADYIFSLTFHGFKTIILLPSQGANFKAVNKAIKEIQPKYPKYKIIGYTDLNGFMNALYYFAGEFGITKEEGGVHAGEIETSLLMAINTNLVIKGRLSPGVLKPLGEKEILTIMDEGVKDLSDRGVLGDPSKADAEKGLAYLDKTVDFLVAKIKKQLG